MKRRHFINLSAISAASFALTGLGVRRPFARSSATRVSFRSLLQEMSDPASLARRPAKEWRSMQASALKTEGRHNPGQFGAKAIGHFIRIEEKEAGRREWVLMEHAGPGALVRMWAPNMAKDAILRIYFDGNTKPSITVNMMDFFYGKAFVKPPFAALRARGGNVYLPMPFAKGCKVTVDKNECGWAEPADLFYIIQYRAYEQGVAVETFSPEEYETESRLLRQTSQALENSQALQTSHAPQTSQAPKTTPPSEWLIDTTIDAGQSKEVVLRKGSAAIDFIALEMEAKDMKNALRTTLLKGSFDGNDTIDCPVGDFFGSGSGLNPFSDWIRSVEKNGRMTCRWVMPYEKTARLQLVCTGSEAVRIRLSVNYQPWKWDQRSLYFHANWGLDKGINDLPTPNFNFISIRGKGLYVGDTLSITNYSPKWWGEGPEKISVDGEPFPSLFGTGSEDYYGYAWGDRHLFSAPFHAQPKIPEGPEFQGTTVNTRIRSLDAIPFRSSLELNMEILTQGSMAGELSKLDYGVATYWYGSAGTTGTKRSTVSSATTRATGITGAPGRT